MFVKPKMLLAMAFALACSLMHAPGVRAQDLLAGVPATANCTTYFFGTVFDFGEPFSNDEFRTDNGLCVFNGFGVFSSHPTTNALVFQRDGNFVQYHLLRVSPPPQPRFCWFPMWQSNTAGHPDYKLVAQFDGNLVIYAPDGSPKWFSNTFAFKSGLVAQDDGNLVIYNDFDGKASPPDPVLWSPNTYRGNPIAAPQNCVTL